MEVCGSVLANSNYQQFRLKCIYCTIESELKDWELFIYHVKTAHYVEEEEASPSASATSITSVPAKENEDLLDSTIAYDPDDLYEIIETVDVVDEWLLTEGSEQEIQYVEEASLWSEPTAEFCESIPDGSESEANRNTISLEANGETSQNDMASAYTDADMDDGSDFCPSDEEPEPRRRPGRPSRRTRPGQVFKFKVSFIRSNPRVLHLIQAYKEHPCLWNPSHNNYADEFFRTQAYFAIIRQMDIKADVLFTVDELKRTLAQLHTQYTLASQSQEQGKLVGLAARYFAKCAFLSVAPSIQIKEEEENSDVIVIKLNFKEDNIVTSSFIETYANYPQLYNPAMEEFTSVDARAEAYEKMAAEFMPVVKANETDVYIAVNKLRRWVYDAMRRIKAKELIESCNKQEVQYLRMCSFLPAKGSESAVLYCEYCDKRFHGDYNLRVHMFKVHAVGDLPYLCAHCPRRFDRQVDMDRHKLRSHFERKLKCDYCDKTFAVDNDLRVHTLIHTGEKPHVCPICGKGFRLKLLLDHHVNGVHLNLRPHICHLCNKSFRKKFELSNHIKGHLNIRDKKCELCDASFYDHSSLSRHRRMHRLEEKA
ncbi:hypothetical protein KR009_003052 [Drosophila setifemur]|nr:hypothetical protein KR009_003052 [Drosophila setifemur]